MFGELAAGKRCAGENAIREWWVTCSSEGGQAGMSKYQTTYAVQDSSGEQGITLVQLVTVMFLLGMLIVVAVQNYLDAESAAKSRVDRANVSAINMALALYKAQNNGGCPPNQAAFAVFLEDAAYFPRGAPTDPYRDPPDSLLYTKSYNAALCRVQMLYGDIDHTTGAGH